MGLNVTIVGSYRKHLTRIAHAAQTFTDAGAHVLRPRSTTVITEQDGLVRLEGDPLDELDIERLMFDALDKAELVYVINPGGIVGPSALTHVGYAHARRVPVICAELPVERAVLAISTEPATPVQALERVRPS